MFLLRAALGILLWLVVTLCIAVTVIPHFLDRIYYRGPVSSHFDGARFFNPDGEDESLAMRGPAPRGGFIWRQIFGDSERPDWPSSVPVAQAKPPAHVDRGQMLATWVGHATLLVQADGLNILTDPIYSGHAGPFGFGPRRVTEPGIRFEDLPQIDLVVVSHNHYDHMDLATLKRIWDRDKPMIVSSLGNDAVIAKAGIPSHALDWGQRIAVKPGIWVAVTRNHHWDSRWFRDRNRALWSSFTVGLPSGNFFFAGDTGLGDGKWPAEAAALGPVRLAAVPIGAFRFRTGQMASGTHIGPYDAIRVWEGLGMPRAIPMHWGTFRLSYEGYRTPPDMLAAMLACAGIRHDGFGEVAIGKTIEIPALDAQPKLPAPDMAGVDACMKAGRFDAMK